MEGQNCAIRIYSKRLYMIFKDKFYIHNAMASCIKPGAIFYYYSVSGKRFKMTWN